MANKRGEVSRALGAITMVDQKLRAAQEMGLPIIDVNTLPDTAYIALGPDDVLIYRNRAGEIIPVEDSRTMNFDGNGPGLNENAFNLDGNG